MSGYTGDSYSQPVLPSKRTTPQSERDYQKVRRRVTLNGSKIFVVSNFIDRYFGTHVTIAILMSLAKIIMQKHKLKLDRLARRNRQALLCWYAENWDIILPILKHKDFSKKIKSMCDENSRLKKKKKDKKEKDQDDDFVDPSNLLSLLNNHPIPEEN